MAKELCAEIKPCPTETPPAFCDPKDICSMCAIAATSSDHETPTFQSAATSCLATVNWACSTGVAADVMAGVAGGAAAADAGTCYDFCGVVPAAGLTLDAIT